MAEQLTALMEMMKNNNRETKTQFVEMKRNTQEKMLQYNEELKEKMEQHGEDMT